MSLETEDLMLWENKRHVLRRSVQMSENCCLEKARTHLIPEKCMLFLKVVDLGHSLVSGGKKKTLQQFSPKGKMVVFPSTLSLVMFSGRKGRRRALKHCFWPQLVHYWKCLGFLSLPSFAVPTSSLQPASRCIHKAYCFRHNMEHEQVSWAKKQVPWCLFFL